MAIQHQLQLVINCQPSPSWSTLNSQIQFFSWNWFNNVVPSLALAEEEKICMYVGHQGRTPLCINGSKFSWYFLEPFPHFFLLFWTFSSARLTTNSWILKWYCQYFWILCNFIVTNGIIFIIKLKYRSVILCIQDIYFYLYDHRKIYNNICIY